MQYEGEDPLALAPPLSFVLSLPYPYHMSVPLREEENKRWGKNRNAEGQKHFIYGWRTFFFLFSFLLGLVFG